MTAAVWQAVSFSGAATCLAAYWLLLKRPGTWAPLTLNVVASLLLAAAATHHRDVGFISLNLAWLGITLRAIRLRLLERK